MSDKSKGKECGTCEHYRMTGRKGLDGVCALKVYGVKAEERGCGEWAKR